MERARRKRAMAEEKDRRPTRRNDKKKRKDEDEQQQHQQQQNQKHNMEEGEYGEIVLLDERELVERVFEFPWKGMTAETDGCDLRDVFFSSLVDGSSAKMGLPGDRLGSCARAPFELGDGSWPSEAEEVDGPDCFWGALLRPPTLVAGHGKGAAA